MATEAGGSSVVTPEGSRSKATTGLCFPSRTSELIVRVFLPGPAILLRIRKGDERAQEQTRALRELEEHVVATAGGSVLASQDAAHKERVRVVTVQPQYTAGQPSIEIRVEIRCPLDMSRGQRISTRISVV